jgi:hypothetical protein
MVNDDDDVIRRERAAGVQRHSIASRNSTRSCVSCRICLFQFFVLFFSSRRNVLTNFRLTRTRSAFLPIDTFYSLTVK